MLFPTLGEVKRLSEQYSTIPVFWEIPADHWSPLQIYAAVSQGEEHSFLLESVRTPDCWQNWSYIGWGAELGIAVQKSSDTCAFSLITPAGVNGISETTDGDWVKKMLQQGKSPQFQGMPEFTGGFAGFRMGFPAPYEYHLYYTLVAYDHLKSTAVIILNLHSGIDLAAQYQAAEIQAAEIAAKIERFRLKPQYRDDEPPIQVVQNETGVSVEHAPDSFELYRRIRSRYPSPYLFYVKNSGQRAAGTAHLTTEDFSHPSGDIAGFWSCSGIRKTCLAEIAVRYAGDMTYIDCKDSKDTEVILELMRSAKLENTSIK